MSSVAVLEPLLDPQEQARADLYALIARLYAGPPDAALLRAIGAAEALPAVTEEAPLAQTWRVLQAAAAGLSPVAIQEEYERLFVGVGRAEISLYVSYYLKEVVVDSALARLRGELAQLGLTRHEAAHEPEDHIACLAEAMRCLIQGDGAGPAAGLAEQSRFFAHWLGPEHGALAAAIQTAPGSRFYRAVSRFAGAFFAVEAEAFEMA